MSDSHEIVKAQDVGIGNPTSAILHPAVEKMLALSPTPETLEKILTLQREWERDQAKRAYTRALVEMRRDLPAWIKRDQTVDYPGAKGRVHYTHASLAAAIEAVQPALTMHGFHLSWTPAIQNDKVAVTATLTHREGHSESATLSASPDASGNKNGPQAVASTVTLLQRYTALALLGIATSDMEEPKSNGAPHGQDVEHVDSARNMRAMADIAKAGKTKEQAEEYAGKPIQKWTSGDLARLKEWITPSPRTVQAQAIPPQTEEPAPIREPGVDEGEDNADALLPTDGDKTPISEKQRKWLFVSLSKAGKTHEQLKAYLVSQYGIASTKDIPQMLFPEILEWTGPGEKA